MTSGEMGLFFALVVQFGGLVWGASRISSSVDSLSRSVTKLDKTVEHLDTRVQDHETRVSVLERIQQLTGGGGS